MLGASQGFTDYPSMQWLCMDPYSWPAVRAATPMPALHQNRDFRPDDTFQAHCSKYRLFVRTCFELLAREHEQLCGSALMLRGWNKAKDDRTTSAPLSARQNIARREAEDVGVTSSKQYACSKAAEGRIELSFWPYSTPLSATRMAFLGCRGDLLFTSRHHERRLVNEIR